MINKIINSKNDFHWKEEQLIGLINTLVDAASKGNMRNAGVIVSAIKCLNDMAGHNAPVSTVYFNLDQDEYIKKLNEVTIKLIEDKKQKNLEAIKELK